MTVLINALVGILLLFSVAPATYAQEKMIFLARIPGSLEWCGDRAVLFSSNSTLIWLDVFGRRQIKLQVSKLPFGLHVCSPDGRWVIVREGGMNGEGGDLWCDPPDMLLIPKVVLWDTINATPYSIGTGFFKFAWAADGRTLLYYPWAICNLETDRRTRLRWPVGIREFRPLALRPLLAEALKGTPGWADNGRIGAAGWIESNQIVAQIPDAEGDALTGVAPNGAIVLMHIGDGRVTRMEQLNPRSSDFGDRKAFRTTFKLNVSQVSQGASDDILRAAGCSVDVDGMSCQPEQDTLQTQHFRPNLERYCSHVQPENSAFCRPTAAKDPWRRFHRGKTVLLLKPVNGTESRTSEELFRVENDEGRYLK